MEYVVLAMGFNEPLVRAGRLVCSPFGKLSEETESLKLTDCRYQMF